MFSAYESMLHLPIVILCMSALAYCIIRNRSYVGAFASFLAMCLGESLVSPGHAWLFGPSIALLLLLAGGVALQRVVRRKGWRPARPPLQQELREE